MQAVQYISNINDVHKDGKGLIGISNESDAFFKKYNTNDKNLSKVMQNVLSNNFFDNFIKQNNLADKSLIAFLKDTNYSTKDLINYQKYLNDTSKATSTFSSQTKKAGNILKFFKPAIANMLISVAVDAAVKLFTTLEEKEEQAAQKAQAVTSSFNALQNSYTEGANKIGELSERYNELSGGVSAMGENISLTDDEYAEYKNTVSELSGLMPNLNALFNEQGEKIGFVGGKLKDTSEQYQKYMQTQAQALLRNGDEDGNTFQDTLDDFKYSSETNTNGWSTKWRDYLDTLMKELVPYFSIGEGLFNNGNHSDWGSKLFGATQEYSTQEQLEKQHQRQIIKRLQSQCQNSLHRKSRFIQKYKAIFCV